MYQPTLGQFLSRDPLSENGVDLLTDTGFYGDRLAAMSARPWLYARNSTQPYVYAGNNPVRYVDPSGLDYLDCLADCVSQNDFSATIVAPTAACAIRVPKRFRGPGQSPTKSIWTTKPVRKVTGMSIKGGMIAGRISLATFIFEGFYDLGAEAACALICGDLYPGVDKEWYVK